MGCDAESIMNEMLMGEKCDIEMAKKSKPLMPADLEKWLEFNSISSANLRGTG